MSNKLVLEQIVIPLPEPSSFIVTYLYFGLLFAVVSAVDPTGYDSDVGRLGQVITFFSIIIAWPLFLRLAISLSERFMAQKNLEKEFEQFLEDW